MAGKIVIVTAPSKVAVSIKAELLADKGGHKFTPKPPYFCHDRQTWVHELEVIEGGNNDA